MKILTATLTLVFALAMPAISRAQCHESDCCDIQHCQSHNGCSHANKRHHSRNNDYMVSDFKVYYRGKAVEGATASSFTVLGKDYAKDAFRVFYKGQKIEGTTASSFTLLGDRYAKDSFRVFYKGQKIEGATASSFTLLGKDTPKIRSECSTKDRRLKEQRHQIS